MQYNSARFKILLKLSLTRLKTLQQKKASLAQQQRSEIANLLRARKIESATIRVEHVIREDLFVEALEILELFCEVLSARMGLIDMKGGPDPGIIEACASVMYGAPRCAEVKELIQVKDMLVARYGKEFATNVANNVNNCVNERIVKKLVNTQPDADLVQQYLATIASAYEIDWVPLKKGPSGDIPSEYQPESNIVTLPPSSPPSFGPSDGQSPTPTFANPIFPSAPTSSRLPPRNGTSSPSSPKDPFATPPFPGVSPDFPIYPEPLPPPGLPEYETVDRNSTETLNNIPAGQTSQDSKEVDPDDLLSRFAALKKN